MNCAEFKKLLVAYVEDLLDEQKKHSVTEHLKDCAACQAELKDLTDFRERLVKNGRVLAQSALEDDVMNQIVREQNARPKAAHEAGIALKLKRIIMKSPITKLAAAAVIIIAVLVGVSQIFGGTVTFADVIQPILNARTVVFDFIVGEEETGLVIHDIVAGSRIRRTFSNMETILILDLDNAKMLTLDPTSKGAMYVDIQGPIKEKTKNFLEFVRGIVARLKDLPVVELGQREVDGQQAVGFSVSGRNEEVTIWADPKTSQPIRIELLLGQSRAILKNIEFDVPVDESLVSMEPPDGYTLAGMEYNMNQFTEGDFIESLRMWAELLLDGQFPESISVEDYLKMTPVVGGKIGQLGVSREEGTRLGMKFGRGVVFFQQLSGVDWHYAGSGVKLGEADKAIFWYQPKDSENYRVIYGDLHVEEVAADKLPK